PPRHRQGADRRDTDAFVNHTEEGGIPSGSAADDPVSQNPLRDPRDRRLPRIAGPSGLVIFGVTGDLSKKKLIPAVYDLANRGLLPPGFSLVGFGRRQWTQTEFAEFARECAREK